MKEEALFYTLCQLLAFLLEPLMLLMAAKAKQLHSCSNLQRSYLLGAISDSAWTGWAVILTSKLVSSAAEGCFPTSGFSTVRMELGVWII